MKRITVEYRKFWRTRHRELSLPERWDELTGRQFVMAVRLWLGTVTQAQFLMGVFGFRESELRRMDDYQKWVLLHAVDWMQDLKRPHNAFFLRQLPGSDLTAPGPRLKGCTLQQYMTVDTFFSQYLIAAEKGGQFVQEKLDDFIAALYKKENEVFSMTEGAAMNLRPEEIRLVVLEDHLRVVRGLDECMKQAIVMNYVLIRSWLCRAFPHLFPETEQDDIPTNKPKVPKPTNWLQVFDAFVGDNIADMEKYQAMQATDAFRVMNRRIREAKKRAAQR